MRHHVAKLQSANLEGMRPPPVRVPVPATCNPWPLHVASALRNLPAFDDHREQQRGASIVCSSLLLGIIAAKLDSEGLQ